MIYTIVLQQYDAIIQQYLNMNFEVFGNSPLPRFGHSITPYAENKVCLFGGATGRTEQFSITDNTYTLDLVSKQWRKVETTGTSPSARAAHGAVCIESHKIVIYGGATGAGGLVSDDLFHLEIKEAVGSWHVINVKDRTPGKRYGHTVSYSKPYIIVFGGNVGDRSVNDCWILNIIKPHLMWEEVVCESEAPCPRVYHSAALCSYGSAAGMIVVFGGRDTEGNPLADSWGLRRHRNGRWDWVAAPQKSKPSARYQHSSLFVGPIMLVIGGRRNLITQWLPLQAFDTQASEWSSFQNIQRFRHGSWLQDKNLMIYGGFQLTTPNVPTDSIMRVSLSTLFSSKPLLLNKLNALDTTSMNSSPSTQTSLSPSSTSSTSPSRSTHTPTRMNESARPYVVTPTTPNLRGEGERVRNEAMEASRPTTASNRRKIKMLDPVLGNDKVKYEQKKRSVNVSKQEIPAHFLDNLLQPNNFLNAEHINFVFKTDQIITLCNIAEDILKRQPMILQARTPLKIFGDLHGQFTDLMSFFSLYGTPHQNGRKKDIQSFDYIFLGDFIDRGNHSLQTICLLLALKCVYPQQVHLIRGNHQDIQINASFGFKDECQAKLQEDPDDERSVFNRINKLFNWLPLATVIEDKILCLHGGIGKALTTLADIQNIERPLEVMHEVETENDVSQVVLDILWSDPTPTDNDMGIYANNLRDPSNTGNIVQFGPDRVHEFLKLNKLEMIVRAHECVMDGLQRFAGGALITVFSATDYCRKHKNAGAILIVKTNYEIIPKLIYPTNSNVNNWIEDEEQLKRRPPTPPRWREQKNY